MVVTRFAPSPTGYVHIGNLRTALYAYLFARHHNGELILRIEDTDQKRYVEDSEKNLLETLKWAGIEFSQGPYCGGENGPYRQSERVEIHREHAQMLLDNGKAYYCFCSAERLEKLREQQEASQLPTGYDGHCRHMTEAEINEHKQSGDSFVVRLKVPKDQFVVFNDAVRGKVKFSTNTVDDQVLLKSDGYPTYHLANVVDDKLMKVTHVIRGEEWLPSTPKHVLLYQAFGWEAPQFAHLPLILNADRSKLSKRQGDVAVGDYRAKGYEAQELINFIAFLGWSPGGTKEIYTLQELVDAFTLEKVQKSGAVFNREKLDWYRGVWRQIRMQAEAESKGLNMEAKPTKQGGFKLTVRGTKDRMAFAEMLLPLVEQYVPEEYLSHKNLLLRALYSVKEKVLQKPEEVLMYVSFFFSPPPLNMDLFVHEKMKSHLDSSRQALQLCKEVYQQVDAVEDVWEEADLKEAIVPAIQEAGLKNGQVLWPLRVALTHAEFSPGSLECAWVLGKTLTIELIDQALEVL